VRKKKGISVLLNDEIVLMSYKNSLENSALLMVKYQQKKKTINRVALDKMMVFRTMHMHLFFRT
jgi:hypothetical protein